jgi:hypothetical protein
MSRDGEDVNDTIGIIEGERITGSIVLSFEGVNIRSGMGGVAARVEGLGPDVTAEEMWVTVRCCDVLAAESEGVVGLRLGWGTWWLRWEGGIIGEGGKISSAVCVVISSERNDGDGEGALADKKESRRRTLGGSEVAAERGVASATGTLWV